MAKGKKAGAIRATTILNEQGYVTIVWTNIEQARQHRAIAIKDNDFAAFVDSGAGEATKTPDAPAKTVRRASTAKEAAGAQTVGVRQMQGG